MANFANAIKLTGLGTPIAMFSSVTNCSTTLNAGIYAVWATGQNGYISFTPASTAFTVSTGYPVLAAQPPIMLNVPQNGQIGAISTSSGAIVYQQVG